MRTWLKELRKNKNLTQAELAKILGIRQNYYCEIENGKKQPELFFATAIKLADIFGLTLEEIRSLETEVKA